MGLIGDIINGSLGIANYKRQQEHFEFEKQLIKNQWARDDNAVQRRRADLESAGMNPVLAAGDAAGNSSPIQTTAPQFDTSSIAGAFDLDGLALNMLTALGNVKQQQLDLKAQSQQIVHAEENFKYDNLYKYLRNVGLEQAFRVNDYYLNELYPSQKSLNESYSRYYNNQATELGHDLKFREQIREKYGTYMPKNVPNEALNFLLAEQGANRLSSKLSDGLDSLASDPEFGWLFRPITDSDTFDSAVDFLEKNIWWNILDALGLGRYGRGKASNRPDYHKSDRGAGSSF